MNTIGNTLAMVGAVVVMGWLMIAQAGYQRNLSGTLKSQTASSADVNSLASNWVDHETVVMK